MSKKKLELISGRFKISDAPNNHNAAVFYSMLVLRYLICIFVTVATIGPFLWLLSIALRTEGNIYDFAIIPKNPSIQSFIDSWTKFDLQRGFFNSVLVAVITVFSNVLLSSLAAYPLARLKFPGKNIVFFLILCTLMIPFQLYMIPLYLLCVKIGITDSYVGIILPFSVGAFGIYLIKQYYQTIPMDLEEAARVDGAGELQIWGMIMFPLTKPAIATLAIFVFVGNWSSFLWPLIILNNEKYYTLPVKIAKLSGAFIDKTNYLAAGSVIVILPVILLFLFMQRYFIGGITMGSVKG